MERKREVFVKVLLKVKLVLINIRFKLDISMPVMVTNPSIGFGVWQYPSTRPIRQLPKAPKWKGGSKILKKKG